MSFEGTCPSCGAPVTFDVANSVVTVCESCSSVVGRGDGKLENYGKVADLVQTDSPLRVGLVGEVRGVPYEITGRTQLEHAAGGVWDEWYVAFRDGKRWGWLAEAQGKYYLTFPKKLPASHAIPPLADLSLEEGVMVPGLGLMKVVEKGEATAVAAEGEIPFRFVPGERYEYADLAGPAGKFATIDNGGDTLQVYAGGEFPLERLGISPHEASREEEAREVAAESVSCPQCGGALELVAPREADRVACPYCDSLLDYDQGNLKFLRALHQKKVEPAIPLGSKGTLRGREYQVIGFLQRRVKFDRKYYYWTEYLLYTPRQPFHWLIHSNGHWTLGKPVSAGAVDAAFRTARYEGKTFRAFERSTPEVSAVYGQFYWKVNVGERVGATDYVRPPFVLSREETLGTPSKSKSKPKSKSESRSQQVPQAVSAAGEPGIPPVVRETVPPVVRTGTPSASSHEVNYTLGEYVPAEEVERAFGVRGLPAPRGISLNQPFPYAGIYRYAALLLGAALLIGLLVAFSGSRRKVYEKTFQMSPGQTTLFSEPFQLEPRSNIRITCSTPRSNAWMYLDGSLYNERNAQVETFSIAIPQSKAGVGRKREKFLSAVSPGTYTMRLQTKWQDDDKISRVLRMQVHQGVPRMKPFLLLLLALAAVPIGVAIYHFGWESTRWQESSLQ